MHHHKIRSIVIYLLTQLDPMVNPMARRAPASVIAAALLAGALSLLAAPAAAQTIVPTVPRNVRVVASDSALMLTWQAPSSWGTHPAAGYQIDWAEGASAPRPLVNGLEEGRRAGSGC